ncbi:ATP-binding protein [Paenibacillus sp. CF384]|uniref:ATP-binding protein n=1 Tax=Paenibacillus sp. CF384 TaxID=1884382 RepID=UPI00089B1F5D|nr:ATP-binding protein [Paenibacillus sp. CF384]SDX21199.1 two-component system, sporulation sensor kinase B [Paenibacillus sp. CF384]
MSAILIYQFHGLLYILASCTFVFISPRIMLSARRRNQVIAIIMVVLSTCYQLIEPIDPLVFSLHLMPISIMMTSMFEGTLPGIMAGASVTLCGFFFVGTDIEANLVSNVLLLLLGLWFHYRMLWKSQLSRTMGYALVFMLIHYVVFLAVYPESDNLSASQMLMLYLGTMVSAVVVVITCNKVRSQENMQEELYKAEKFHMIGELAASISHEIRNPLTTTHGFLQMMAKPGVSSESMERYRLHAIEGVEHANAVITDFLNYAKPTIEEARPINVIAEIEGLIPWIAPLSVMSSIEIQILHQQKHAVYIMGEPKKFQQCLLNLIKNAIEAMPAGGLLTISTRIEKGQVYIQISDTGVGMSKLQLRRIGMPFFTTKEKGTGLGLMVVVSLVKVMGGEIIFTSESGQGTVCEIKYGLYG